MTLGERLRKYLPDGVEQKVVAMNWIQRIEKAGMKGLKPATVPSRLSELLADDPQGVRTFFRDPRRANALFDELGIPEAERAELRALAEPILAGAPQARLVVDVSDLGEERLKMDAVFAGVREALFGDDGLFPVAVVLTDAQYDLLPRSFDRFKDRMQLERVSDAGAGAQAATRLTGDSVCLVSQRPLIDLSRWWAASVEKGALVFEPADGMARLRSTGSIGIPEVAHPLTAANAPAHGAEIPLPPGGVARRRLVAGLADEASAESRKEPSWRRAAAKALGVRATSTKRERTEAEIAVITAKLGTPIKVGTSAEWDALVARAARRPSDPVVLRVGDQLRALNPAESVKSSGLLTVTRLTCAEPHLVTLERAISDWSEDDLLDDPLLGGVIHRLAGKDQQALKLLFHARAVLVYGGRVRPKPRPAPKDPLAILQRLLATDVPEALLRIRVQAPRSTFGSHIKSVELPAFVYPDGKMYYEAAKESRLISGVPPVGDVLLGRGATLQAVVPSSGREQQNTYYGHGWSEFGKPAALIDPTADATQWLDDVEASPLFGATDGARGWSAERHLPEPKEGHKWALVPEPADLWRTADINLALAWLALRDSLPTPRSIAMPDGAVLLQVGGGLAARLAVRRHGAPDAAMRGAVCCPVSGPPGENWSFGDLAGPVTTHIADTAGYHTRLSVLMPSIWLAGSGFAVDVSFIPAPMLPGGSALSAGTAAGVAGAVASIDAAQREADLRRMYDDD